MAGTANQKTVLFQLYSDKEMTVIKESPKTFQVIINSIKWLNGDTNGNFYIVGL